MKQSNSIKTFHEDLLEIFNSVLTLNLYRYITATLKNKKEDLGVNSKADLKLFDFIEAFEAYNYIYNSLYINLVAILETYLQDRLYEELKSDSSKIHKLVLNYNLERKFTAKDIIEGPNPIAQEILDGIIYHNLPAVNILYKVIFNIEILSLMKNKRIFEIIKIRHKIVHRSGRIDEKKIFIRSFTLLEDMTAIAAWVENMDFYILNKTEKKSFPNYGSRHSREFNKYMKTEICKISQQDVLDKILEQVYDDKHYKKRQHHITI
jgi:hypothetical protein